MAISGMYLCTTVYYALLKALLHKIVHTLFKLLMINYSFGEKDNLYGKLQSLIHTTKE